MNIYLTIKADLMTIPAPLDRISHLTGVSSSVQAALDDLTDEAVDAARAAGATWDEIREALAGSTAASARPASTEPSVGGRREHHGKYRGLWQWLVDNDQDEVELTFSEIERILGFPLPPSSREHLPHWHGYKGSAVARAIIDAGFRARNVSLAGERVTVSRVTG